MWEGKMAETLKRYILEILSDNEEHDLEEISGILYQYKDAEIVAKLGEMWGRGEILMTSDNIFSKKG
jgi:hypothetical protein